MVWFHGGAFAMGSPMHYNGQVLASLNDVVVVMPAYRVNVFGFLSLGRDTKWSGNMGMLDQVMALEWTRDNIKSFGGDPSNVTIFGESAGGASVGLHMVSPLSRGLFHRSISQSGIASMADDAVCESPHLALCEQLKIAEKDPAEMMNMLKKVSATAIMIAQEEILKLGKYFIPVVDGKFLPRSATEMMNSRQLAPVPYMIGFNSTEANGLLSMKIPGFTDGLKASDVEQGIKGWMMMTTAVAAENQEKAAELILQEYTQHYEDDDKFKWSKLQGEFTADTLLVLKSMDTADANQATGNPTYVYRMSHRLRLHHEAELGRGMDMKPDFCECDHGDDLYFTFGLPLTGAKLAQDVCFSAQEQKMSEIWMRYLTNFARHGNPNEGESVPVEWPLYCKASRPYLDARMPFTSGEGLLIDKTRFWRENIYKL